MNKIIPSFLTLFALLLLSACKYDSAAPIRDIRFDPKLLGKMQAEGSSACTNYFFTEKGTLKNLGTISSKYVLVSFDPVLSHENRQKVIERYGFVDGIISQSSSKSAMHFTIRLVDGLNCQQAEQAIRELSKDDAIQTAAPYFLKIENGREQLISVSNNQQVKLKNQNGVEFASPEFVVTPL